VVADKDGDHYCELHWQALARGPDDQREGREKRGDLERGVGNASGKCQIEQAAKIGHRFRPDGYGNFLGAGLQTATDGKESFRIGDKDFRSGEEHAGRDHDNGGYGKAIEKLPFARKDQQEKQREQELEAEQAKPQEEARGEFAAAMVQGIGPGEDGEQEDGVLSMDEADANGEKGGDSDGGQERPGFEQPWGRGREKTESEGEQGNVDGEEKTERGLVREDREESEESCFIRRMDEGQDGAGVADILNFRGMGEFAVIELGAVTVADQVAGGVERPKVRVAYETAGKGQNDEAQLHEKKVQGGDDDEGSEPGEGGHERLDGGELWQRRAEVWYWNFEGSHPPLFCAKSAEATEKASLRGALLNARVRRGV